MFYWLFTWVLQLPLCILWLPLTVLRQVLGLGCFLCVWLPLTMLNGILEWALAMLDGVLGLAPRLLDTERLPLLQVNADTTINTDTAANSTMDNTALQQSILHIVRSMKSLTSQPFIIVGGASLILHGSNRTTADVDFLILKET